MAHQILMGTGNLSSIVSHYPVQLYREIGSSDPMEITLKCWIEIFAFSWLVLRKSGCLVASDRIKVEWFSFHEFIMSAAVSLFRIPPGSYSHPVIHPSSSNINTNKETNGSMGSRGKLKEVESGGRGRWKAIQKTFRIGTLVYFPILLAISIFIDPTRTPWESLIWKCIGLCCQNPATRY